MVKVLIDGKEYEGNEVTISDFENTENIYSQTFESKKPKFVSVPKEIQFVATDSDENKINGLSIYPHTLRWTGANWEFTSYYNQKQKLIDCVLVPVKRSELKAGDWAYSGNPVNSDNLQGYCLILNFTNHVSANNVETLEVAEYEWIDSNCVWFKVVPRSEVEKE